MAIQALRCIRALDLLQDLIHQGSASDVHIAKVPPASKWPMRKLNYNKYVSAPLRLTTRAKFGDLRSFPCNREAFFKDCMLSCEWTGDRGTAMTGTGGKPEYSDNEIHNLLRRIRSERPSNPNTPERPVTRPQPASNVERELTIDEIIDKIQRAIARDQPMLAPDK